MRSNRLVVFSRSLPADYDAWHTYWKTRGHSWRTEPELDIKRRKFLAERRAISPDVQRGIYPFKGVKLERADIEWLLATHENGKGPVDWSHENQRHRKGLDLRGADLRGIDLHDLPLACLSGGLSREEWHKANEEQRAMAAVLLDGANLRWSHLEGSDLRKAHLECVDFEGVRLEKANLRQANMQGSHLEKAHLEEANLRYARLDRVDLRGAHLDRADLYNILIRDEKHIGPRIADIQWGNINHAAVGWSEVYMLCDEYVGQQKKCNNKTKDIIKRLQEYEIATRANRQLAVVLQEQGLVEDAIRFTYRAQSLQKQVFWFQLVKPRLTLRQRVQALGAWLFSWFLFLIAGYGYRLWRSFLTYLLVILGFALAYYLFGSNSGLHISLVNALALSMTSFHGRGFFPGITVLNDTLTVLASLEAFVGLVLEVTLIATLTQRFFGK